MNALVAKLPEEDHGRVEQQRMCPPTARGRGRLEPGLLAYACWVLVAGCREEPSPIVFDPATSDSSTGAWASGTSTSTTSAAPSSTSAVDDSGDATRGVTTVSFLIEIDAPSPFECDLFVEDCPPGEKCTVWSNDGAGWADATKCVPVVDDPVGPGEPCHVQGSPLSGLDDCELGAYCWYIDPKTLEGICVSFCVGDESIAHCEDPALECTICGGFCAPLCLPRCDPLLQDCPEGRACYPVRHGWACELDASGAQGGYGDPCELINACDPRLVCLESSAVPPGQACEGAAGCCTEICDLLDPAGDLQCAGAAGGQVCQPWYEEGTASPGYEDVGVCTLPM